jgi:hypothetical protein
MKKSYVNYNAYFVMNNLLASVVTCPHHHSPVVETWERLVQVVTMDH